VGVECGMWNLEFGMGFGILDSGFGISDLEFWNFGIWILDFRF